MPEFFTTSLAFSISETFKIMDPKSLLELNVYIYSMLMPSAASTLVSLLTLPGSCARRTPRTSVRREEYPSSFRMALALSGSDTIVIKVVKSSSGRSRTAAVYFDGTGEKTLSEDDEVIIKKAEARIKLIKLSKESFLEVLSRKM